MNEKIKKAIIVGILGLLVGFFVFAARVYVLPVDGGTGQDSSLWNNVWIRVVNGSWTSSTNVFIATGTAPTIDAITNIGIDTTGDQLQYYGTAKRIISYLDTKGFVVDNATTSSVLGLWRPNETSTISRLCCKTSDSGIVVNVILYNGSTPLNTSTCAYTEVCTTYSSNNTVNSENWLNFKIGTTTDNNSTTSVSATFYYTKDQW